MGLNLSLIVSTMTFIVTVSYYYRMVVLGEMSEEAKLFDTLHSEYSNRDMMIAFETIDDFQYSLDDPKMMACEYAKLKTERTKEGRELDRARRTILHWYQKVVYFHRFGLLHNRFLHEFPGRERARHFIKDVEPLALASCKIYKIENCSEPFDYIRKVYHIEPHPSIPCAEKYIQASETSTEGTRDEL